MDHTAVLSGAELALCTLISSLDRRRWSPRVILGQPGPLVARLEKGQVPVEVLPMPHVLMGTYGGSRRVLDPRGPLNGLAYAVRLARLLRRKQVDLVHSNSVRSCVLGGVAAWIARLPSIWHVQSVVAPPMFSKAGVHILRRLAAWLPAHVIFNSEATAAAFGLPRQRHSVIPVGVDAARFSCGRVADGRTRIGMIARLAPLKGQHVFVEAALQVARRHGSVEFVVAGAPLFGEEDYARTVRAKAAACDRIRFLGFVDDVPALLRELDVVVHASVLPEAFGQTVVEAMLASKPVIATALGGPLEIVKDGVTGVLVPAGDPAALAAAMDALLPDPARAADMGRRGRERAVAEYGSQRYASAVESVYEKVLNAA